MLHHFHTFVSILFFRRKEGLFQSEGGVGSHVAAIHLDGNVVEQGCYPVHGGYRGLLVPMVDGQLGVEAGEQADGWLLYQLVAGCLLDEHDGVEWMTLHMADATAAADGPSR